MAPRLSILLMLAASCHAITSTSNTGDQHQGFTFGYTTSQLVLPTAYTCPTPLTLTQLSPTNDGGSDPAAPYTMIAFVHEQLVDSSNGPYERIYARTMDIGDMSRTRTIKHPWMNGTQFIGCIWAANGISGGCQDLMTIAPNELTADAYASPESSCRQPSLLESWVTPSNRTLDVDVQGAQGTVAVNGWPASCSDLMFTPKNGTGPYTLVIAPAFHPPVNISSSGSADDSMNYTIRLTHGQAFMAGVFDSVGNSWAVGPLHAGAADDLACLARKTGQTAPAGSKTFGTGVLAGSVVASLLIGALAALLLAWLFGRERKSHRRSGSGELLASSYGDSRPINYRVDSGASNASYGKTQPFIGYSDMTPPIGFDTPAALYDPVSSKYPTPPTTHTSRHSHPDPGAYPIPYDTQQACEQHNTDFSPQWRNSQLSLDQRSSMTSAASRPNLNTVRSNSSNRRATTRPVGAPSSPILRERSFNEDEDEGEMSPDRRHRRVYVVHSDAGGADLHIQLPDGHDVVELPPNYRTEPPGSTSPPPKASSSRLPPRVSAQHHALPQIPLELRPTRSRNSGLSDMSEDEIRARARAALAEKSATMPSPQTGKSARQ